MDASSSSSSAAAAGASRNDNKEEAGAAASTNNSNTASSSTIMIATALLDEFYQQNKHGQQQQLLADSCKVLAQLIRKAVEDPSKFGRIRLNNPRIQNAVAQVPGALDVLAVAGFGREDDNDGDSFLVFQQDSNTQQEQTCLALCHNLDTKRSELLAELARAPPSSNTNNTKNNNNNSSPFLSQEERVRRQAAAKQAQKAKRLERQRALSAWKEDEHNRKLKAQRREAALQGVVAENNEADNAMQAARAVDLVPQIRIQKLQQQAEQQQHNQNDNDTEMADAADVGSSAPAPAAGPTMIMSDKNENDDGDMLPPSAARLKHDNQNEDEDMKEAAVAVAAAPAQDDASGDSSSSDSSVDKETWQRYLETTPRCAPAPGIRETSVFKGDDNNNAHKRSAAHWKHVLHEWDQMKDSLPSDTGCTIFVRFDEDAPHFGRALVPAALCSSSSSTSTPYAGGAFLFDLYLPPTYPQVPPKVQLLTTGGGSVRFGPNLYACGKVCLSLLGTWEGPKWRPKGSTLTQVLVSLQGLILGAPHPYYLEPGHGGWEGHITETQFQATGHTLRGDTVQTQVVPRAVAIYENTVRVGTLRYALLEPAKLLCEDKELPPYWQPLQRPLHLHLYHNRDRIVREWAGGRGAAQIGASTAQPHPHLPMMHQPGEEEDDQTHETLVKQIAGLAQKVETALAHLPKPLLANVDEGGPPRPAAAAIALAVVADNEEDDSGEESDAKPSPSPRHATKSNHKSQAVVDHSPDSVLARLQQLVQAGNHIQAKQWQQQSNVLQDLAQRMHDATAQGDHTTAGLLQQQLQGGVAVVVAGLPLQDDDDDEQEQLEEDEEEMEPDEEMADGFDPDDGFDNHNNDDGFDNDDEVLDGEDDDDDDDGWDSGNQYPYHYWGAGTALKSTSSPSSTAKTAKLQAAKPPAIAPYQSQRSSGTVCRLRVRLPNDTSIMEQFDGTDTLADLYQHVEQFLHNDEDNNDNDTKPSSTIAKSARRHPVMGVYGPEMVNESAFTRPLSLKGFTLLLARPKKEFSLEMHGTRPLQDLGLVPSATLTVLDCHDRGVVKRGDLERRLEEAQGDAMNVDGLTYEGLLELTERVGPSGRGAVDPKQLQAQSTLWSPQDYMGSLKAPAAKTATTDNGRCPVCLGEFDPMETEPSLRQLNSCGHVFHVACLDTWLETKKACPLCNQAVV